MKIENMRFRKPFFDPWVGKNYGKAGSRRILVVGASHYCGDCSSCGSAEQYADCRWFTQEIVSQYLDPSDHKRWMRTYSVFTNSIFGHGASQEECEYFWSRIVFMNYLQRAEGADANEKHSEWFGEKCHFKSFCSVVKRCRPEVVIVWGERVWNAIIWHLKDNKEMNAAIGPEEWSSDARIGDYKFKLLRVYHPSCRVYQSADNPHERFVNFGCDACSMYDVTPRREMITAVRQLTRGQGCESKCRVFYLSGERQKAFEDDRDLSKPWLACGVPASYRSPSDGKMVDCFACIVEHVGTYEVGLRRSPESDKPFDGDGDCAWWFQWDKYGLETKSFKDALARLKSVLVNENVALK